ncbi:MAG: hypothetical protein DHS20C07_17090 [Methyloligella sp.]|nr:MAG: hypothetical protein DHS20C07_17090 [Methyloligella sp.]
MERKSINQHLQDNLANVHLSEEQLSSLKALQEAEQYHQSAPTKTKVRKFFALPVSSIYLNGMVACVVFFLSFILFAQPTDLAEDISHEVVSNHILLKPLEVKSSDMGTIKKHLVELQFNPIVSKVFNEMHGRLLGGRYCSIKRALAVQLRYDTGNGKSSTLYETSYHPKKFSFLPNVDKGEEPLEHQLQGLRVRLWIEKGLVLASVTE